MAAPTTTKRVERWVWIMIYLGMIGLGVGLAVQRSDAALGWPIAIVGIVMMSIGVLLIWIRSRMTKP